MSRPRRARSCCCSATVACAVKTTRNRGMSGSNAAEEVTVRYAQAGVASRATRRETTQPSAIAWTTTAATSHCESGTCRFRGPHPPIQCAHGRRFLPGGGNLALELLDARPEFLERCSRRVRDRVARRDASAQVLLHRELAATFLAAGEVLLEPGSIRLGHPAVDEPGQQILALEVRIRAQRLGADRFVAHRSSGPSSVFILWRALCIRVFTVLTGQSMIWAISSQE